MKNVIIPTVNILVTAGDKVLLSRRANTGWADGMLCIPGGHVEEGETPTVAILREAHEELGIQINESDINFLCMVVRNVKPMQHAAFQFTMEVKNYEIVNAEPEKCSELVWVEAGNLPDDVIDDFRIIIDEGYLKKSHYIEFGFK